MTEDEKAELESSLFPEELDLKDEISRSQLLEQYRIFVQSSETLVGRRQTVNTFFLSINSLLLAAISVFASEGRMTEPFVELVVLALTIAGAVLSYSWWRLVRSYRQLNAGKFKVIHLLEKHLPAAMFKAEWEALGSGTDKSKYSPFTTAESRIPYIFFGLYIVAAFLGLWSTF